MKWKKKLAISSILISLISLAINDSLAKKICKTWSYERTIDGKTYLTVVTECHDSSTTNSQTTNQHTNKTLYKQKQEKHYNWIKPNKYNNWQCAYELIYPHNDKTRNPYAFYLYVDTNGDNKPDYRYKYDLTNVGHYYTGIDFDFKLDYYHSVVGDSSIEDNAIKALNTCGLQAIREFIWYNTDHDNPADYLVDEVDFENYHRIYASFYEK
jgi:hypothetical protein